MNRERFGKTVLRTLILSALMALMISAGVMAESYVGNMPSWSYRDAGGYRTTRTVYGTSTSDYYYMRFYVPSRCRLDVSGWDRYGYVYVALYNSDLESLEPTSGNMRKVKKSGSTAYYALNRGTYYIRVSYASQYFTLKLIRTSLSSAGSTKSNATYLSRGATKTAFFPAIGSSSASQWFKISVASGRRVKITINSKGSGRFSIQFTGNGWNKSTSFDANSSGPIYAYRSSTYSSSMGLTAGTYYIRLYRNTSYRRSYGFVKVKWSYY